ncbi:CDP-alcohol phosphatidyltransferase family protein [Aminipila terrae]|uniref:CDP-alcohol phosphatidyltransferase family protein n=1 Tax=Aminipila terrae TaxID=2697030 RepID=UPI001FAD0E28|nr:CDP-alcohol phosphatidyltransferase family protein [Aminipila terrae]
MIIIRHIPNILSTFRIIFSVLLLFIKPLSLLFFTTYMLCGISDILDGYIARKLKCNSSFGAALDSMADLVLTFILLIIFIPIFPWSKWMLYWIGAIASIKLLSLTIGMIKYHTFTALHTYANKATGLTLFCSPLLYSLFGLQLTASLACITASAAAMEELGIITISKELQRNSKSIIYLMGSKKQKI